MFFISLFWYSPSVYKIGKDVAYVNHVGPYLKLMCMRRHVVLKKYTSLNNDTQLYKKNCYIYSYEQND